MQPSSESISGHRQTPRVWRWLVVALAAWSFVTWATGGFFLEWQGLRISSRDPIRPLLAALLVVAWALWRYGRASVERELAIFRVDLYLARWFRAVTPHVDLDRWSPWLALTLSIATVAIGLTWTTRVAGGSDSYAYVSQARLWVNGDLIVTQPIATTVPWPNAESTFTPIAYKPIGGGSIVSIVASGYPMLMALFSIVHPDGIFWVVPIAGALLVGMTFVLGRSVGGAAAGLLACALMASSPAFLFQLVAPMSDVVIAALWITALAVAIPNRTHTWLGAGTISSLAILTRPNTAPIAAAFAVAAFWNWTDADHGGRMRERLLKVLAYVTGTVPGVLSVAAINTALYGGPLKSGYDTAAGMFALAHFAPNATHYLASFITSETPIVCLAIAAPWLVRERPKRWLMAMMLLCAGLTWLCYVFYEFFVEWWYLRFLLTAFPCILALAAVTFTRLANRMTLAVRVPVVAVLLAAIFVWRIDYAIKADTFNSWKAERRYSAAGQLADQQLEANAILYSAQHSGSLRYYGHRLTVRWDFFDGQWLDRSIDILKQRGYKPYFVLEEGEQKDFRTTFSGKSRYGRLDWPPIAEVPTAPNVRIYDPEGAGK